MSAKIFKNLPHWLKKEQIKSFLWKTLKKFAGLLNRAEPKENALMVAENRYLRRDEHGQYLRRLVRDVASGCKGYWPQSQTER